MEDRVRDLNKLYAHVDALISRYPSMSVEDATRLYLDEFKEPTPEHLTAQLDAPDYEERMVDSSCIKTVGYDRRAKSLMINWTPAGKYGYLHVPENEYHELLDASSVGAFVNRNIKGQYQSVRLN